MKKFKLKPESWEEVERNLDYKGKWIVYKIIERNEKTGEVSKAMLLDVAETKLEASESTKEYLGKLGGIITYEYCGPLLDKDSFNFKAGS